MFIYFSSWEEKGVKFCCPCVIEHNLNYCSYPYIKNTLLKCYQSYEAAGCYTEVNIVTL